jgi:hypothetical protein
MLNYTGFENPPATGTPFLNLQILVNSLELDIRDAAEIGTEY